MAKANPFAKKPTKPAAKPGGLKMKDNPKDSPAKERAERKKGINT